MRKVIFAKLIKAEKEELDLILKRIAGSYVYWYNRKYRRTGHLFQDRFKSEAVENDDKCLEFADKEYRLSDSEARAIIEKISKCKNTTEFQRLNHIQRNKYITEFKENGISIRQISRLTGVNYSIG